MKGFILLDTIEGNIELVYAWECRFTWMQGGTDGSGMVVVTPQIGQAFTTKNSMATIIKKIKESDDEK